MRARPVGCARGPTRGDLGGVLELLVQRLGRVGQVQGVEVEGARVDDVAVAQRRANGAMQSVLQVELALPPHDVGEEVAVERGVLAEEFVQGEDLGDRRQLVEPQLSRRDLGPAARRQPVVGVGLALPHPFEDHANSSDASASTIAALRRCVDRQCTTPRRGTVIAIPFRTMERTQLYGRDPSQEVYRVSTTDDRRFEILRAIVTDYVDTQEPIGSKALVERHQLGVSSATVRNDMAVLEAEGYITQPHTSSGRVPTDKGYRMFVDRISEIKPLSAAERRAILSVLDSGVDLDDVLRRSVRLLAQLTRQVAVIQYPVLSAATVRHLEVVTLSPSRLLLVVIVDNGRVEQRMVALNEDHDEDEIARLRDLFSAALHGKRLEAASAAVAELANSAPEDLRGAVLNIATVLVETLVERGDDRLVLGGTSNLARSAADFTPVVGGMDTVLEALEEQVVVLKILATTQDMGQVTVQIGEETRTENLRGTSVVSTGYGASGTVFGGVGVLGPTRMDYPGTIASVAAVAKYIGEVLAER
ncbi:heat-inducible transcription repressor [Clostridioides difficile]|nr:heat-inducible transcription repressor [Clostridioides difficile]